MIPLGVDRTIFDPDESAGLPFADTLFFCHATYSYNNGNFKQIREQNDIANQAAGASIHPDRGTWEDAKSLASAVSGIGAIASGLEQATNTNNSAFDRIMGGVGAGLSIAGTIGTAAAAEGRMCSIYTCFTAGTQVVVGVVDYSGEGCGAEYVTANIEDIKVGDYVLTQDVETGEVSLKEVTETFVRTSDHLRYLTTVDEDGDVQTIETTDGHPFWVVTDNPDLSRAAGEFVVENGTILYHENLAVTEHGYYVEAKDLKVGDVFIGANGELTTLAGTERVEYPNEITVYNFSVEGNHNYYVIANLEAFQNGASVILVHNASGYRAVSQAEYDDIVKSGGFRQGANSLEGKWFATSREGAEAFGNRMKNWVNPPSKIVKADVPDNIIENIYKNHDGISDAFYIERDKLDRIISVLEK